ncbi:MAG: hypothetical protein KF680_07760 [Cryobacterium sp.]|nr:hypothetical protein [Cryobacterium sp.]
MATKLSYEGDAILPSIQADSVEGGSGASCLVWGTDLSRVEDRRLARQSLHEQATAALRASVNHPALQHLVLVYRCAPQLRSRMQDFARGEARRLHATLELERASDVDVVMVDITGLDDDQLPERRFNELARRHAGITAYAAITWEVMRHESINDACSRNVI